MDGFTCMQCCAVDKEEETVVPRSFVATSPAMTEGGIGTSDFVSEDAVVKEGAADVHSQPLTPPVTPAVEVPASTFSPPYVFDVQVDLKGDGLTIETFNESFGIVRELDDGAKAWNAEHADSLAIKPFDKIKKVDGQECSSSKECKKLMSEALQKGTGHLELTLCRPSQTVVEFKKPGLLGFHINYTKSCMSLWISEVTPGGLLQEWNDEHPGQAVSANDRIISVDGASGSSEVIIEKLKETSKRLQDTGESVKITIYTYGNV
eukprot:TRINITY_DN9584_c0_g1_i1.p1 TRINITY_DN9584_c0_g1~~TRINITY_DN9584_c0_g1_i1.p1  ORF type:complete len:263 (-),score=57.35 TRINITY_DN9584_c0_g1_i1:253-1041(-)